MSSASPAVIDPALRQVYTKPKFSSLREEDLYPGTYKFNGGNGLTTILEDEDSQNIPEEGVSEEEDEYVIEYPEDNAGAKVAAAAANALFYQVTEHTKTGSIENIRMNPFPYEIEVIDTFMIFKHVTSLSGVTNFKNDSSKTSFTVKMRCGPQFSIHTLGEDLKTLHEQGPDLCTLNFSLSPCGDDLYSVQCSITKI